MTERLTRLGFLPLLEALSQRGVLPDLPPDAAPAAPS